MRIICYKAIQNCDELSSLLNKLKSALALAHVGLTNDGRLRLGKFVESLTTNLLVLMDKAVIVLPTEFM